MPMPVKTSFHVSVFMLPALYIRTYLPTEDRGTPRTRADINGIEGPGPER